LNITLAAYAQGLGTCVVASFHAKAVQRLLGLPERIVPVLIVAVGHAAKVPKPPARKVEGNYFFEAYDA
jgi:nitroreductase